VTNDSMLSDWANDTDEDAAYHAEARGERPSAMSGGARDPRGDSYTDSYNYDGGANTPNDAGVLGSDPNRADAGPYQEVFNQPFHHNEAPDPGIADGRVRHLVGHADSEGDVGEVAVVGAVWRIEAREVDAGRRAVVQPCVPQQEDRIDHRPRQDHGYGGDDDQPDADHHGCGQHHHGDGGDDPDRR